MIFVPQEPRKTAAFDTDALDNASDEHSFVFPMAYSPSFDPNEATDRARVALADFDFDRDSVAQMGGDPLAMAIVIQVLTETASAHGVGGYNWNRFERAKGANPARYSVVRVPFAFDFEAD